MSSIMLKAAWRSEREPQRIPSSRYQPLRLRPGTSSWILSMMGCRRMEKAKGPKGSPCWTPVQLRIE